MTNASFAVFANALRTPHAVALRCDHVELTYGELWRRVDGFVAGLTEAGLGPGDRGLLISRNSLEYVVAYYGLIAAGVAVVPISNRSADLEVEYFAKDSQCSVIVADEQNLARGRALAVELGIEIIDADHVPGSRVGQVQPPVDVADDDTVIVLYTSGTTGRPKGAELTHDNLIGSNAIFEEIFKLTPDDRMGHALPLFHVMGQITMMGTVLAVGAELTLFPRFKAETVLDELAEREFSILAGVPTMWVSLVAARRASPAYGTSTLRFAGSGGAPLPHAVAKQIEEAFGCVVLTGYGLTEATGIGTCNVLDDAAARDSGTVGKAVPTVEVAVFDDHGDRLPAGTVGEVCLRGPINMKGYWNRPDETKQTFRGAWLRSGDLGHMDEDGYLWISGRSKEVIIRGGYNVYPKEIEEILHEINGIRLAAVIGVPDDLMGEEVAAVLEADPDEAPTVEQIVAHLERNLTPYKRPTLVSFVDALPLGATGKVQKRAINVDIVRETAIRLR